MNRTLQIVVGVIILVLIVAGSFYAGTVYAQQQAFQTLAAQSANRQGPFANENINNPGADTQGVPRGRFGPQGGGTFGQIEEIDGNSLVITDRNEKQIRVQITDTTLIEKYASVTITDLAIGEAVIISGSENEDGSITARSLQVAPAGRFGGNRPGAAGNGQ